MAGKLTELNLKAVKGLTRSNQFVIFFPKRSGRITIKEFPILRTTISDLKFNLCSNYSQTIRGGHVNNPLIIHVKKKAI